MARWDGAQRGELPGWRASLRGWVRANDACRRDILDRLGAAGPLPSRALTDTCAVPWKSSGWTNNKNVSQLLEFMVLRGEVAVAGRRGGHRLWDLAGRVYPGDPVVPADEARRTRDERRLRALGIARARGPECPVEPADVSEVQARGQAPVGVLRAADPVRRPADGQARRPRRPQGRDAPGPRDPPGRPVLPGRGGRRGRGDQGPGPVAGAFPRGPGAVTGRPPG